MNPVLAMLAFLAPTAPQLPFGAIRPPSGAPDFDTIGGIMGTLTWDTAPADPIAAIGEEEGIVMVVNQPGARLAVFGPTGSVPGVEAGIGIGGVSAYRIGDSNEALVVDQVQHSVSVVDLVGQVVTKTIRVNPEPHQLVFNENNTRAYVTCSTGGTVDVIDMATRTKVNSIPLDMRTPRAAVRIGTKLYVFSFLSGNNTAPLLKPSSNLVGALGPIPEMQVVDLTTEPGLTATLPDLDMEVIDLTTETVTTGSATGLGTILLAAARRPGTDEIWITNWESLNTTKGVNNFVNGHLADHRITVVDVNNPGTPVIIPLGTYNVKPYEIAPATDILFKSTDSEHQIFLPSYGTDTVHVLRIPKTSAASPGAITYQGHWNITASDGSTRSGPRNVAISRTGQTLLVFNKIDDSFTRIDLTGGLPSGASGTTTAPAIPCGFDPTASGIKLGRHESVSSNNSGAGTSSCNTCHLDGDQDGLGWDLSGWLDAQGTAPANLTFEQDVKGVMVTQSLRGLAAVAPFHWRGEREALEDFNGGAFDELLRNDTGALSAERFQAYKDYVFSLVHPANPHQNLDRGFTTEQAQGFTDFKMLDSDGAGACVVCHALPTGTNNEPQRVSVPFIRAFSTKVAQLRGIQIKEGDGVDIDGDLVDDVNEFGWGFAHRGEIINLRAFLDIFSITDPQRDGITEYLKVFDSGLAPMTTYQVTLNRANSGTFTVNEWQNVILPAVQAGQCEVAVLGRNQSLTGPGGIVWSPTNFWYDEVNNVFVSPSVASGNFTLANLINFINNFNYGGFTFVCTARGLARNYAIDADGDGFRNWDEVFAGTDQYDPDTDGDGFPDGHEIDFSTDPLVANGTTPDNTPPSIVTHPAPWNLQFFVMWETTKAGKVFFTTDEPARVTVTSSGDANFHHTTPLQGWDVNHFVTLAGLDHNGTYSVNLLLEDRAGNTATTSVNFNTVADVATNALTAKVDDLNVSYVKATNGVTDIYSLTVTMMLTHKDGTGLNGVLPSVFLYNRVLPGAWDAASAVQNKNLNASHISVNGVVTFQHTLPAVPAGSNVEVAIGVREIFELGTNQLYVEALDTTIPGTENDKESFHIFALP